MDNRPQARQIKKEQWRNASMIGGMIMIGILCICYFTAQTPAPETETNSNKKANYASPLDQLDTQSVVLERTQKQLHDAEAKTEKLQQKVDAAFSLKQEENKNAQASNEGLSKRIDGLEKQFQTLSENKNFSTDTSSVPANGNDQRNYFPAAPTHFQPSGQGDEMEQGTIREDKLLLSPSEDEMQKRTPLKNPDTYVPSGTFVKAVIIGGADASTSVTAQANPNVVLLRTIENGTLPNHRKSHLKNCMAVGRAIGDISSERGSITIERLSCVFANDEVVDQKVEAIVFGPDGKVDVRGNVREGGQQYVGRAFAAGALSGLSEGLSQAYTANSISPEGNVQTVSTGKVFQYGGAKGASKAMDKLADYQMRKAEQFHPIVQLSAGTVVDIVFQMGFFLDGKEHEDTEKKAVGNYATGAPNAPALFPAPSGQNLQTLPLSQKAIERIEKYDKELGLRVDRRPEGAGGQT